jgi:hypothetical protein
MARTTGASIDMALNTKGIENLSSNEKYSDGPCFGYKLVTSTRRGFRHGRDNRSTEKQNSTGPVKKDVGHQLIVVSADGGCTQLEEF